MKTSDFYMIVCPFSEILGQMNRVFAANSDFLMIKSLQPDLRYFKHELYERIFILNLKNQWVKNYHMQRYKD